MSERKSKIIDKSVTFECKARFKCRLYPNDWALTHEVHDQLAYAGAEDEVPHEVGDEGEGDAEQGHHEVADGEGQQEQVGDGPHAPVPHQDPDDEAVTQNAEEEDEAVEDDPHCLVDVWKERETNCGHVILKKNSIFGFDIFYPT